MYVEERGGGRERASERASVVGTVRDDCVAEPEWMARWWGREEERARNCSEGMESHSWMNHENPNLHNPNKSYVAAQSSVVTFGEEKGEGGRRERERERERDPGNQQQGTGGKAGR